MTVGIACTAFMALYLVLAGRYSRRRARRWPWSRATCCACGVAMLGGALSPAFEAAADRSFALHMFQHILLAFGVAPLILSGAPLLLAFATAPPRLARPFARALHGMPGRVAFYPPLGWLLFVGFLWASHFSGLYELSLRDGAVHAGEHAGYLVTALLFWWPLLAVPPTPWHLGYPARILYVFLTIPQNAFLSLSIYSSRHVLYASYATLGYERALAGQRAAGALMWVVGGLGMLVTVLALGAGWMRAERALTLRVERADASCDAVGGAPA